MKLAAASIIFILSCYLFPKPKFRYLDRRVPLYVKVNNLPNDSSDLVSGIIKDSLYSLHFDLIVYSQFDRLLKQFFADVQSNLKNAMTSIDPATRRTQVTEATMTGTPCQRIVIIYSSLAEAKSTIESCDSVGFTYLNTPFRSLNQTPIRKIWSIKDVGSRTSESIAFFLLKNM
jgi:hypothetical protein